MVTLPQVSSATALCQEDASFSHPPQTPDPAKSSASTPTAKTLSVSRGFPGLCWCLDAPGMENNGERGILAARLKLTWGSYGSCPGITAHRLFQPCTFIPGFPPPTPSSPHLIQSPDLSQIHMTGGSESDVKPVLRDSEVDMAACEASGSQGHQTRGSGDLSRPPLSEQLGTGLPASGTRHEGHCENPFPK